MTGHRWVSRAECETFDIGGAGARLTRVGHAHTGHKTPKVWAILNGIFSVGLVHRRGLVTRGRRNAVGRCRRRAVRGLWVLVMVDLHDLGRLWRKATIFNTVATSADAPENEEGSHECGNNTSHNTDIHQNFRRELAAV